MDTSNTCSLDSLEKRGDMIGWILLGILIFLLLLALPLWPFSRGWGFWPSGILGTILLIIILLLAVGVFF